MRYQSTEEAHNAHLERYRSDGMQKTESNIDNKNLYRINFITGHVTVNSYVLDVGCNTGTLSIPIKENRGCRVKGIDIVPELVEKAKKRGIFAQVGIAEELPFNDETFDHVVCGEVIEHLFDPKKAINEAYRVLKNGGSYLITVPWNELELGDFHHQKFTPESIKELIKSTKFINSNITIYGIPCGDKYCDMWGIPKDVGKWIGVEVFKNA